MTISTSKVSSVATHGGPMIWFGEQELDDHVPKQCSLAARPILDQETNRKHARLGISLVVDDNACTGGFCGVCTIDTYDCQ
jgi:hypothetical protein